MPTSRGSLGERCHGCCAPAPVERPPASAFALFQVDAAGRLSPGPWLWKHKPCLVFACWLGG